MPNSKISALTAATTPLAGTEVLPIVQSGATKQVSVANLTAGRAVSAASLALTTSPLPTTSGGTALTSFTNKGVVYASSTSALATGSALEFDGTNFGVGTGGNTMNHQSVLYKGGANAVYYQIGNGLTGLASTQGIRLGLTAAAASELYTINSFNLYVDGSSALSTTSARNTTFTGGNLVQGTAAKGVNFTANTPAAGMTSQLLNWYEHGAWTTGMTADTGTITLSFDKLNYTRVGRMVTISGEIVISALSSPAPTGDVYITLPFTSAASSVGRSGAWSSYLGVAYTFTGTPGGPMVGLINQSSNQLIIRVGNNAGGATFAGFLAVGTTLDFGFTYQCQ